jgi:uncharacterized protein YacL
MNRTLHILRSTFFALCLLAGYLVWYVSPASQVGSPGPDRPSLWLCLAVAALLGALTILFDLLLKGFSLRALTAVTFGLIVAVIISALINASPFFDHSDQYSLYTLFKVRIVLFVVTLYLATVMALRGRDEFSVIIPYVRFVQQDVPSSVVVVDTSALIDGRVLGVCQSHFLSGVLVVPRFIIEELNRIADSPEPQRQSRGRRGLEVLNELRRVPGLEVRMHDVSVENRQQMDEKLIFVARSLKASLLTTDYNLAKLAELQDVAWLNLNKLAKALHPEVTVGDRFSVELVKPGKESGQAVGFLGDGSMVVVNEAEPFIGHSIDVEVITVLPTAGGKMVFARATGGVAARPAALAN